MFKKYLTTQTIVPADRQETWAFFSNARNLALITPPEMQFRILGKIASDEIFEGMQISYNVRPALGIPIFWKTLISSVEPLHYFVDLQLKGPYALWEHTHVFEDHAKGTLMTDHVEYALPGGAAGDWLGAGFVERRLKNIFTFREQQIAQIFKTQRAYALAI